MRMVMLLPALALVVAAAAQDRQFLRLHSSEIVFVSDAPLEHISATNVKSTGVIDIAARTFAVQVPVDGFQGFNSPLQREHFKENYMDARTWPNAVFQGRIIESIDLRSPGEYQVRAKGNFTIRGVVRERIVPCVVRVDAEGVHVRCEMEVPLDDHDIRVPRVVRQKIAPVIVVRVAGHFTEAPDQR